MYDMYDMHDIYDLYDWAINLDLRITYTYYNKGFNYINNIIQIFE